MFRKRVKLIGGVVIICAALIPSMAVFEYPTLARKLGANIIAIIAPHRAYAEELPALGANAI